MTHFRRSAARLNAFPACALCAGFPSFVRAVIAAPDIADAARPKRVYDDTWQASRGYGNENGPPDFDGPLHF